MRATASPLGSRAIRCLAALVLCLVAAGAAPPLEAAAPPTPTLRIEERQPSMATEAFLDEYRTATQHLGQRLGEVVATAPLLLAIPGQLVRWLLPGAEDRAWRIPVGLASILIGGALVEILCRIIFRAARRVVQRDGARRAQAALARTGTHFFFEALAIVAFQIGALCFFFLLYDVNAALQHLALATVTAVVVARFIALCSRLVLAPAHPEERLVGASDAAAIHLHRHIVAYGVIVSFGYLLVGLLGLAGVEVDVRHLIVLVLWTALAAIMISAIGAVRPAQAPAGEGGAGAAAAPAIGFWHILLIIFVIGLYVITAGKALLGHPGAWFAGLLSLSLLPVVPFIDALIGLIFPSVPVAAAATPHAHSPAPSLEIRPIRRWLRLVLIVASGIAIAEFWDIDLFTLANGEGPGARLLRGVIDISVVLLLASLVWELVKGAIDRRIAAEGGTTVDAPQDAVEEGGAIVPRSRLATLLALLRVFSLICILCIAAMVALSSLGVAIGPLLAGAGIIGLAFGFGSQTLVKDIVSGIFFLLDDAFRLGEYIQIGNLEGTVEKISIRSLRLRHPRGRLHTVPFGEIKFLTNNSRDWAIMKLELRLPFDTDLGKVKRIVKDIGKSLMEDPEYGPKFLQPLKSQGIRRVEESSIVVGVKYTSLPMEQFVLRREVFQRLQEAFHQNGIEFARPQVMIVEAVAPDKATPFAGDTATAEALGAAAAQVLQRARSKEAHR
ncbi:MAG: mechanosensitive ion channel family protein [Alphaproteobacteria bacterium]|nr:mechanosensitive ion channel family protein [Alphaproteobacteria bacterium]